MPDASVASLERSARTYLRRLTRSGLPPHPRPALEPVQRRLLIERLLPDIEECNNSGIPLRAIVEGLREEIGIAVSEKTVRRIARGKA